MAVSTSATLLALDTYWEEKHESGGINLLPKTLKYSFTGIVSCSYFTFLAIVYLVLSSSSAPGHCFFFFLIWLLKWGLITVHFPVAHQPTYIYPCHLAPIYMCKWQPHSPVGPLTVPWPRELTVGGRSIKGVLIIPNRLPGRKPWHIFITMVIKAISDYHQDMKLTRHLEWADYPTWWDFKRTQSLKTLAGNLRENTEPVSPWFMQRGSFKDSKAHECRDWLSHSWT